MKIVHINAVPYGSTGGIMFRLADIVEEKGSEALCTTGFSWTKCTREDYFITSNIFEKSLHTYLARFTGMTGCFSAGATKRLLKRLNEFDPDVIHLHNLHGWFVRIPDLFRYIKKNNIPVIWTLHDCWSFTGHCPHFTMMKCDKWKSGCFACSQTREYPKSYIDQSKTMWKCKKNWFTGVQNLTIITPSQWLADLVKQSFLKDYPVKVIHNGIDLSVFRPTESGFRAKVHCEDKTILLGVAFGWGERKGLDVFIELSKRLDERFQIILVGTDEKIDKLLPKNIISIHRTQNQTELAEIYTVADLFVNPTREDNYPTVNMEAIACGTPVLTFRTGGSPEILDDTCGCVVDCDDIDALEREILRISEEKPYTQEACLARAKAFDMNDRFQEYIQLYESIRNDK